MNILTILLFYFFTSFFTFFAHSWQTDEKSNPSSQAVLLNDNAGWCWFQDDRAIIDGDQLLFTSVTSEGANTVTSYNMKTGEKLTVVINDQTFEADDHNVGALLKRPDGRYLTVYAGHGVETKMRYRISTNPGDISAWGEEKTADTGGRTTYSNVFRLLESGKTYNFHRGAGNNPNYMVSEDDGETWSYGGQLFSFPGRPYLRYTTNHKDRIHFITTEEHPRHYNNSIYHGYIEGEEVFGSDGQKVGALGKRKNSSLKPYDFTCIYDGDSTTRKNVAWTSDIELDKSGYPYVGFSVTKDPIKLGETQDTEEGGFDHRYHYARWDGQQWHEYEIAYAGARLYAGENEYTGLISLHPNDPNVVYISTNVHPETGNPLRDNGPQHYEIFRGTTKDQGATWQWTAITENSDEDNIRPMVVCSDKREVLLWLKGRYTTYRNYDLSVYGLISNNL
ncbi:BNR-4 repeat-containing protein [Catalinimonas sp. 4WD22]|uniref:BNR-4 repeat-containing protein n=1 Tax=Catalinimonas locisalis TaxID=3133978 RepID=UPI003101A415